MRLLPFIAATEEFMNADFGLGPVSQRIETRCCVESLRDPSSVRTPPYSAPVILSAEGSRRDSANASARRLPHKVVALALNIVRSVPFA